MTDPQKSPDLSDLQKALLTEYSQNVSVLTHELAKATTCRNELIVQYKAWGVTYRTLSLLTGLSQSRLTSIVDRLVIRKILRPDIVEEMPPGFVIPEPEPIQVTVEPEPEPEPKGLQISPNLRLTPFDVPDVPDEAIKDAAFDFEWDEVGEDKKWEILGPPKSED